MMIPSDGLSDGGVPYSDEELAIFNAERVAVVDFICAEDFNGTDRGYDVAYWADYYPAKKVTVFGGDWQGIPDMPSDTVPTDKQCHEWVKAHLQEQED